jgi:predicted dehydrogenase
MESVEEGKEPTISGESVLTAMRAVFASIEASKKGIRVKIEQ